MKCLNEQTEEALSFLTVARIVNGVMKALVDRTADMRYLRKAFGE